MEVVKAHQSGQISVIDTRPLKIQVTNKGVSFTYIAPASAERLNDKALKIAQGIANK